MGCKTMNSELSKKIGQNINTLLAEKRVKQKELAEYLKIPDNTVSYFVSGKRLPNTEQIVKIADFFKVSSDYLLGLDDTPTNDKDLAFVCKYTGCKDYVIKSLIKTPVIVILLNNLLLSNEGFDFIALAVHIEAYKRQHQGLIYFMEQTINSKSKWKSENDLNTLSTEYHSIINRYELTEYQIQKTMVSLLENYCKTETEKIAELKNAFDEIIGELVIKYGEIYDE